MKNELVTVLLSGGLDSTTALAYALSQPHTKVLTLTMLYGQRHAGRETRYAALAADHFGVEYTHMTIPMGVGGLTDPNLEIPHKSYQELGEGVSPTYVPFRNALLLSHAVSYTDALALEYGKDQKFRVVYGAHKDDASGGAYPDCSSQFVQAFDHIVGVATYGRGRVEAPFIYMTKGEIVKYGMTMSVPYSLTWSCYEGGVKHCGKCPTCIDRHAAFTTNGIEDPTEYLE